MSKVFIKKANKENAIIAVKCLLDLCLCGQIITPGAAVVIKVNCCSGDPEVAPRANTLPEVTEAVCRTILERTNNITIGDSDGMRDSGEQLMKASGLYEIAEKLNIKTMNFSKDERVVTDIAELKGWGLPKTILEADVFITIAKLKTHGTTYFTGCLKNQWGCVPQYDRLWLHKNLDVLLPKLNKLLRPRLCIMDGIIAMEGRGPSMGTAVDLGIVLASTDPVALDSTAMRIAKLDPYKARHVVVAYEMGLGEIKEESIIIDGPFSEVAMPFVPAKKDWAIKLLNWFSRSRFITKYLILNDNIFYPIRQVIIGIRKVLSKVAQ